MHLGEPFDKFLDLVPVVARLVSNLLKADFIASSKVGVGVGEEIQVKISFLGREIVYDFAIRPKCHLYASIKRHCYSIPPIPMDFLVTLLTKGYPVRYIEAPLRVSCEWLNVVGVELSTNLSA